MDPSKLLRARNDGKVEWNTTRCIPLHTAEYATVILASDWLYFSRHGININITSYTFFINRRFPIVRVDDCKCLFSKIFGRCHFRVHFNLVF